MSEDDTAFVSLNRRVDLSQLDSTTLGWRQSVLIELDAMRAELPYADTLEIRLICERRQMP